ncbi:MAG TPA: hypothetical protein EYP67_03725 [Methanosarcinales archaeon]|nr:hypothetical protein [Methanosarcinales archaeon]
MKKAKKTEVSEEEKAYSEWMRQFACEDPHWKFPTRYVDFSRMLGHAKKFDKLEKRYPDCVDDLLSGVPTYYCVLCVSKSDPPDVVKKAYQRKKECSTYPDDVLERACEMLSDRRKRSDYDEILRLFLKIMQGYTPKDKREMIEKHDEWLKEEKERAKWEYIMENHGAWCNLLSHGAPTLYEILGVDRAKLKEGEEVTCKKKGVDKRLAEEVCRILNNPQLRFEYDFMLDMMGEILPEGFIEMMRSEKASRSGNDLLFLVVLRYYDDVANYDRIMSMHGDWREYMGDKTFYDLLTIDMASIPEDKREAERFIRNAYRDMERTPEVNLAYSVLKNFRMREDYDWMLKQREWVNTLLGIKLDEMDDAALDKVIKVMESAGTLGR